MINHPPGTLAIFVRAEGIEEKCEGLGYSYDEQQVSPSDIPDLECINGMLCDTNSIPIRECPHCYGTSYQKVTLEGYVAVELVLGYDDNGDPIPSVRLSMDKYSIIADDGIQMVTFIIEALHNGTCPKEIRDQLHKVVDEK